MLKIILFSLLIIPTVANADFSLGYVLGQSSAYGYCTCTNEKYKIKELERENQRLKEELEKFTNK
ncbi:MAG: hypothetical protein J6Q39_04175 [Bacteroidales bacterium]|nr:hypothetical protein [Bacteroidales bacterium]